MKQETKIRLVKYLVCLCVAIGIAVAVFAINGFFTNDPQINLQILADGFSVSGVLLLLFAGVQFVSGEGALLGIGFVMRNVVLAFVPMGRAKHETYAQYRERKLGNIRKPGDHCLLFTGLAFLLVGIVFMILWQNA